MSLFSMVCAISLRSITKIGKQVNLNKSFKFWVKSENLAWTNSSLSLFILEICWWLVWQKVRNPSWKLGDNRNHRKSSRLFTIIIIKNNCYHAEWLQEANCCSQYKIVFFSTEFGDRVFSQWWPVLSLHITSPWQLYKQGL